jgi:Uma2 family endonuclease
MDAVEALKLNGQGTPDQQTQDDARWWAVDAAADPVAWQAQLENLWHYHPEYPYDPCHLYDEDRTTDPDYGVDGVHLMVGDVHRLLQAEAHRTLKSIFGDRYITELATKPGIAYTEQLQAVGRRYGFAAVRFAPDIAVVPPSVAAQYPPWSERKSPNRQQMLDLDRFPPPQLVIEIVSEGSVDRDDTFKIEAYALIGIGEYGVYDPEGLTGATPWRLFRLQGASYRLLQPDPELSEAGAPAYWSDVFGMFVRMLSETALGTDDPDPLGHRLQVWDPDLTQWREHATDERDALAQAWEQTTQGREERAFESGLQQGEAKLLETHIDAVRVLLSDKVSEEALVQVEADWRTAGHYRSLEEIAAVQAGTRSWRTLLFRV